LTDILQIIDFAVTVEERIHHLKMSLWAATVITKFRTNVQSVSSDPRFFRFPETLWPSNLSWNFQVFLALVHAVEYCTISFNWRVTRHRPSNPRKISRMSRVTEPSRELDKKVTKPPKRSEKCKFFLQLCLGVQFAAALT
jgi:hypothetical protein